MELNVPQLMALRHLLKQGWELSLAPYILSRTGCTQADWDACREQGLICQRHGKIWLTAKGKKEYKRCKQTKWF